MRTELTQLKFLVLCTTISFLFFSFHGKNDERFKVPVDVLVVELKWDLDCHVGGRIHSRAGNMTAFGDLTLNLQQCD